VRDLFVWPRLAEVPARAVIDRIVQLDARRLREESITSHPDAAPIEIGGHRVDEFLIEELRDRLRACADEWGFPAPLNRAAVGTFDRPATRILHETMKIVPADAAAMGVWNYITLVLLPDVAVWRWPGRASDRLLGYPRNAFRRLWWRAEVVGAELIDTDSGLGEDELVNIMERPTIAADARLSQTLATKIVKTREASLARSEIMRDAAKRILRLQAVMCPEVLSDEDLDELVTETVRQAVKALSDRRETGQGGQDGPRTVL
jgi:hypothetical protein